VKLPQPLGHGSGHLGRGTFPQFIRSRDGRVITEEQGANVDASDHEQRMQDAIDRNIVRIGDVERSLLELQLSHAQLLRQVDDLKTSLEQIALAFEFFVQNQNAGTEAT
jgi:hypothetical protein